MKKAKLKDPIKKIREFEEQKNQIDQELAVYRSQIDQEEKKLKDAKKRLKSLGYVDLKKAESRIKEIMENLELKRQKMESLLGEPIEEE